jgi:chromosome partitioning protein
MQIPREKRRAWGIVPANQKGGESKTTLALALANYLAAMGYKVGVDDCEGQRSLTALLGHGNVHPDDSMLAVLQGGRPMHEIMIPTEFGFDLAPAVPKLYELQYGDEGVFALSNRLEADVPGYGRMVDHYDWLIHDPPPAFGESAKNALVAADGVVIVSQAASMNQKAVDDFLDSMATQVVKWNPRLEVLGLAITLFKPRESLQRDIYQMLQNAQLPFPLFPPIKDCADVRKAHAYGMDIRDLQPKSKVGYEVMRIYEMIGRSIIEWRENSR